MRDPQMLLHVEIGAGEALLALQALSLIRTRWPWAVKMPGVTFFHYSSPNRLLTMKVSRDKDVALACPYTLVYGLPAFVEIDASSDDAQVEG